MPRFFIDTTDQHFFCRDEIGRDFPHLAAAKTAAVDALPDMAREELPDGDTRYFVAIVRREDGVPVLQASLSLNVVPLLPESERG
jgi:hypothetical protein